MTPQLARASLTEAEVRAFIDKVLAKRRAYLDALAGYARRGADVSGHLSVSADWGQEVRSALAQLPSVKSTVLPILHAQDAEEAALDTTPTTTTKRAPVTPTAAPPPMPPTPSIPTSIARSLDARRWAIEQTATDLDAGRLDADGRLAARRGLATLRLVAASKLSGSARVRDRDLASMRGLKAAVVEMVELDADEAVLRQRLDVDLRPRRWS